MTNVKLQKIREKLELMVNRKRKTFQNIIDIIGSGDLEDIRKLTLMTQYGEYVYGVNSTLETVYEAYGKRYTPIKSELKID